MCRYAHVYLCARFHMSGSIGLEVYIDDIHRWHTGLFSVLFSLLRKESTDMCRLTTGIYSEKCVVRRFRRCANVIECTYTTLDSIAYYTLSLYIAYCS